MPQDQREDPTVTDEAIRRIGGGEALGRFLNFLQVGAEAEGVPRNDANQLQSMVVLPSQEAGRGMDRFAADASGDILSAKIKEAAFGDMPGITPEFRDIAKGLLALAGKGPLDVAGFAASQDRRQ